MMISYRPIVAPICAVLLALSLLALSPPSRAESREQTAWSLIKQGALIIDVRSTEEYADGHLPYSLHIPYEQIERQFAQLELRKDRSVVLYCRSGNRSGIAYKALEKRGYSALHNGGGLNALLSAAR